MGVFLAAISKKGSIENEINRILEQEVLEQSFHFMHTKRDVFFTGDKTACLINFASPTPFFTTEKMQFYKDVRGACALQGTIIEQKKELADVPLLGAKELFTILSAGNEEYFKDYYTGDFSVVSLSAEGKLIATCDAIAFQHIYYSESDEMIYVSNRQRCIRSVMKDPKISLENLACLCSIETVAGTDTLLERVKRLDINCRLTYSKEKGLCMEGDSFYFTRKIPELDYRKFVTENVADCVNRLKSILRDVEKIEFPITGGRDSRANLALLMQAGQKEKIHTFTGGFEKHPDVVVGRAISEHYGIPHELRDRGAREFTDEEILTRVMSTVFQSDGSLGTWDSHLYFGENEDLYFPGHASAGFKPHVDASVLSYEDAADVKRFALSKAGFVKPEYRRIVQKKIDAHVQRCREMGLNPRDTADCYRIMERMPNWHGYLIEQGNYFHNQIQILNNKNLFHVSYAAGYESRKALRVHYEIYRNVDPWLVEMPFAVKGWKPELGNLVNDGLNISQKPIPLPKGMPFYGSWQLKLNTSCTLRQKIWDILSSFDNSDFWNYFDKKTVQNKILRESLDSKDLLMMWNFIGSFFFYHSIELPVKIQKKNCLYEHKAMFETKSGLRGFVSNCENIPQCEEKAVFSNNPQIHAEDAQISRKELQDTERYHIQIDDKVLDVLPVCDWNRLFWEKDAAAYLKMLKNKNYLVFIAARDNVPKTEDEMILNALEKLGLNREYFRAGGGSYLAVIEGGKLLEESYAVDRNLRTAGKVQSVSYQLYSGNFPNGNDGYLTVEDVCYRVFCRGYGFVIYDLVRKKVVDHLCMDVKNEWKIKRTEIQVPWDEQNEKLRQENEKLRKRIKNIKNSASYKIGRTVTVIPRKLRTIR